MWSQKRADCSPDPFRLQSVTSRCCSLLWAFSPALWGSLPPWSSSAVASAGAPRHVSRRCPRRTNRSRRGSRRLGGHGRAGGAGPCPRRKSYGEAPESFLRPSGTTPIHKPLTGGRSLVCGDPGWSPFDKIIKPSTAPHAAAIFSISLRAAASVKNSPPRTIGLPALSSPTTCITTKETAPVVFLMRRDSINLP